MSLSRSENRRRLPALSLGRWIFAGFLLLLALAVSAVLFIRSEDAGYRRDENRAIQLAKNQGGLTEVERAELYTWNETLWIVIGKDANNESWIIWERNDGLVKKKLSEGFSESRIRERFASERPSADPIRVLPGWFSGQPVWEIRYYKTRSTRQQGIDFYSFQDGTLLQTYDLPGN